MKLQYLIVIFAIIIIPITLLLSIYIQTQTDTISLQTKYDAKLLDATYDAIVAFQSNTLNNENSTDKDTLRESISASINVFANSLSNNLGVGGYSKEYLMPYVPAMAYTMYDGFYIYSPIENLQTEKDENGNVINTNLDYEHVLKPFIYYSTRYINEENKIDVVINYSLDNYIAIYGTVNGATVTKSGYLATDINIVGSTILYKGDNIEKEYLKENVSIILDEEKEPTVQEYEFVYDINHEKIYFDDNGLFRVRDSKKQYVVNKAYKYIFLGGNEKQQVEITASDKSDESARIYYLEASQFTKWVNDTIGAKLLAKDSLLTDMTGDKIEANNEERILFINSTNDPEKESSAFVQHKRNVIKNCIEENLNNAISSYNKQSGIEYNFKMPKLNDKDWEQIYRNVSLISFLQGLPSGINTYNNYAVITSTGNKEYIDPESIYFMPINIQENSCYHNLTCNELEDYHIIGYKSVDFNKYRKTSNSKEYYYKHNLPACYSCIVASTTTKKVYDTNGNLILTGNKAKAYYEALAREKYQLNKASVNLNS